MDLQDKIYDIALREHKLFPKSQIADYYKLLYQSIFGAEHMVKSYGESLDGIYREMSEIEGDETISLYYDIGLDTPIIRVNLVRCKAEDIPAEAISKAFVRGAQTYRNRYSANFDLLLRLLTNTLLEKEFKKTREELNEFYLRVKSLSFPVIHHSIVYRKLYNPHYRVIPLDAWNNELQKIRK